ncbi:NAD(P)-dependent dehydrogenase (short-subunit alcohol dehydrogenase family) [Sphingomonas sp. BE270]|jgi:NAD(P)-dependent dehydrogenase (short-subunit alcohol dehydrogenase family)|uniref:SDR family NAD(P)-dependent oxidoreductase n=1 Tax=unclassified Sphingomonas TaxID=196159 RepID=UPI0010F4D7CD|nr:MULTISPECIES: SDR family NAD(P)-dependent oxidoreductase [unclassified Sphingomonas]MDR6850173.1 NAD(P)-dependent dehydrogenase (short-subunit alcohol dehydrogenase family) [Sphingomonas sp. BE137]MDR7257107.1 NAD(P)-dependent dehydrogenase (short-subunit alcohol dehydrogenase family) [Sphingomonas sp. BE270]
MTGAAVIIGASGGIGAALEAALIDEATFEKVHGFARSRTGAQHLDLLDEASIAAAAAHVATGPAPTLVIVATGLLHAGERGPEKAMRELDPAWLAETYAINAIGPALVAKHFLPIMPRTGRAVFAALSARVGSISDNKLGGWHGYRASKAALNMLMRGIAIEEKRRNDRTIVVTLHPGTVDTALSRPFQGNVQAGRLFTPDRAALQLLDTIEELKAPDSGKLFDFEGKEVPF